MKNTKRDLELLIEDQFFCKAVLETMEEGVIRIGRKNNILYLNPAAEKILGYKKEELKGENYLKAFKGDDRFANIGNYVSFLMRRGEEKLSEEVAIYNKGGQLIPLRLDIKLIKEGSKYYGGVAIFENLSAIKRLTERYTGWIRKFLKEEIYMFEPKGEVKFKRYKNGDFRKIINEMIVENKTKLLVNLEAVTKIDDESLNFLRGIYLPLKRLNRDMVIAGCSHSEDRPDTTHADIHKRLVKGRFPIDHIFETKAHALRYLKKGKVY